jgi:hypothetical protein
MVEVFTNPGTNSEWSKQHITETIGFVPAIYDKVKIKGMIPVWETCAIFMEMAEIKRRVFYLL